VSFGKWSSILIAFMSMGIIAALLTVFIAPSASTVPTLAIVSVTAGVILGLTNWLLVGRIDTEVARLTAHIRLLADPDTKLAPHKARVGLQPLADAAWETVGQLRESNKKQIAQRRELEVQARISEAQRAHAESILHSISDAVIVTDAFNEVALANDAAARLLRRDKKDILRRPVDKVVYDHALVKMIKDMREAGNPVMRRSVEHKLGVNGSRLTYDVNLSCIAADQHAPHEISSVVTILRDVTKEKEIAEMKSDFVSNVSHELRTPLSSIKAYVEMLVDGEAEDEETRGEFYNIIQGETNRLQRLIDNILNISRIESGVVKVQREHLSMPALIREAIDVMMPQARAKNIELVDIPTPLYFQVFADKDMIYQTTMNLIGNAIKYTPNDGKVTVSIDVDEHEGMVNVSVTDTGIGIPESDIPHLFDKFYRVADHKKVAKGTGLGLNLVKHIVETVHGGSVRVSSKHGEGSTFTFGLPIAENV